MEIQAVDFGLDPETEELRRGITENCHRSDADYAGSFSLCGLLLRLRDYYKWERLFPPWMEPEPQDVLEWIEKRESFWETVSGLEPAPLPWRGREIDPYDTDAVNKDLSKQELYYGAGLAAFLKPSFVLGRIVRAGEINGVKVYYLGAELARDLFTVPAMTRNNEIVARRRPLGAYLWETILGGAPERRQALNLALNRHGLDAASINWRDPDCNEKFRRLLDYEIEAHVRHEYGELSDEVFPPGVWRTVVGANPHSRIELIARTIKDLLADTSDQGRLKFIIDEHRLGSLGVFIAQHDGLAERIFPEIRPAFDLCTAEGAWEPLEEARIIGLTRATTMAHRLSDMAGQSENDPKRLSKMVEDAFYKPLGL